MVFGFALPVVLVAAFITIAVISLVRYIRRGYLYITAGVWMAIGVYCVMVESLINRTFEVRSELLWSPYRYCMWMIGATFWL